MSVVFGEDRELPIALGGARWSLANEPNERLARETLLAAIDAGIRVIDTAPAYTTPPFTSHNEHLIGAALDGHSLGDQIQLVTKCGHTRDHTGAFQIDARPQTLARQCRESLAALRRDQIDLYLLHWPDPAVPLVESVGALAELRGAGLVAAIGVCNVDVEQLREVLAAVAIDAVENRLSLLSQAGLPVLVECDRRGLGYLAYSPVGGPEGAAWLAAQTPETIVGEIAGVLGATPQQIAIAWLLAQSPRLIAIVGAGRPSTVEAALAAARIQLSVTQCAQLSRVERAGSVAA